MLMELCRCEVRAGLGQYGLGRDMAAQSESDVCGREEVKIDVYMTIIRRAIGRMT